jgi:hypothetical protein
VVDVVDEVVERADALRESALDLGPLVGGDDPRHQVEREGPVGDGALGRRQVEGDPLAHEQRVAQLPGRDEPLAAEPLEFGDQRLGVLAAGSVLREDLVVAVRHLTAGAHPHILDHCGHGGCAANVDKLAGLFCTRRQWRSFARRSVAIAVAGRRGRARSGAGDQGRRECAVGNDDRRARGAAQTGVDEGADQRQRGERGVGERDEPRLRRRRAETEDARRDQQARR